jgi:hypothetical protein
MTFCISQDDKGKRRKAKGKRSQAKKKTASESRCCPTFARSLLASGLPAARLPLRPAFPFSSVSIINN